jgi:hypothetical protein
MILYGTVGVMSDRHPADLHFFRNFQSPADLLGRPVSEFICTVASYGCNVHKTYHFKT